MAIKNEINAHVNGIMSNLPASNQMIERIVKETNINKDSILTKVCESINEDWPIAKRYQWDLGRRLGVIFFIMVIKNYLIVADYYPLWPEVYLLPSSAIDALKQTFSRNRIPEELFSDNGSQYRSRKFQKFMMAWNVQHNTSSLRYPRSNGLAESMVKSVKKTIKKCLSSKQSRCLYETFNPS